MNQRHAMVAAAGLVLACSAVAAAQEVAAGPAAAPTTAPATQKALYRFVAPEGNVVFEAGGMKVACAEQDRAVVEAAIKSAGATTRPTTMPADVLERLKAARAGIVQKMAKEFVLQDTKGLNADLDELERELQKLESFHPPIVYVAMRASDVKALLRDGKWECPAFHYNRIMGEVTFSETLALTTDRPMDDTIVAILRSSNQTDAEFADRIRKVVSETQREVTRLVSGQAQYLTRITLLNAIPRNGFGGPTLPPGQQWFWIGLGGVISAEYAQEVTGSPKEELLMLLAMEMKRNPVRAKSVDLLHPLNPKDMKPRFVPAYLDAMRCKSVQVCQKILDQSRDKLPAMVLSLREKPCADGEELVARINQVMGVDVSLDVGVK